MKQALKGARKIQALVAASFAAPAEPLRLELKHLIAPYRGKAQLSLRVENLPQGARLSAGQKTATAPGRCCRMSWRDCFIIRPVP